MSILLWQVYPTYSAVTAGIPQTLSCYVIHQTHCAFNPCVPCVYSPVTVVIPYTLSCHLVHPTNCAVNACMYVYPVYSPVISGIPYILCLSPDSSEVWLSLSLTLTPLFSTGLTHHPTPHPSLPSHTTQYLVAKIILANFCCFEN